MKRFCHLFAGLLGLALVLLTLATPPANAEVRTKGGALLIRPLNRETANFSYTNDVVNPGVPAVFRITTWQGTNHFVVTTNGSLGFVGLSTNQLGYTGFISNASPAVILQFKNGLLITTNGHSTTFN